jgi:hypothetical protein
MHMGATWSRVYVIRVGGRIRWNRCGTVPVGLAEFALLFGRSAAVRCCSRRNALSFHHALMQNYGLVRASQRRTDRSVDTRLITAACLLLPGAALLYRAGMVCDRYSATALLPRRADVSASVAAVATPRGCFGARGVRLAGMVEPSAWRPRRPIASGLLSEPI